MRVRRRAALVAALTVAGLVASFGCQGEDAQGGSTSGSSGITVQVGNGVVDASAPQGATSGEPTALTEGERFSEETPRRAPSSRLG
jgi:hypothetical protein